MQYPKKGRYRHFKGGEYELLWIARHSETDEPMVVYRALYPCGETPNGDRVWVRPLSMWEEEIERDGKRLRRFAYIGDTPRTEAPQDSIFASEEEFWPEPPEPPVMRSAAPVRAPGATDKRAVLKQVFGYDDFRPGQEELIDAILAGRETLGVMPTGAGKSICYQVPALTLPGSAIVISPLISLMKDQVGQLVQAGVPAAYLNSSLTERQMALAMDKAAGGAYRIIYVAPERLNTPRFLSLCRGLQISLVAVDEAHCISQWGQDFRPSYLEIPEFLRAIGKRPRLCAFTATATQRVREDIVRLLELRDPVRVTTGFDRANLFFDVIEPKDKTAWVIDYVKRHDGQSGIVYCATRKSVEAVCQSLRARGLPATRYHAGLSDEERRANQDDFVYDRAPVMVATNAFGMGIDKSSVSYVLHYNMPKDLESYYQEAGRAGRDGERAECILLYSPGDVQTAKFLIRGGEENEALTPQEREAVYRQDMRRLDEMTAYCRADDCLRARILAYFGEAHESQCGNCGRCVGDYAAEDVTESAQTVLKAVAQVERRYRSGLGLSAIAGALYGSRDKRILQLGLDETPFHGTLRSLGRDKIRAVIEKLIADGLLVQTEGDYPVLRLSEEGRAARTDERKITLRVRRDAKAPAASARAGKPSAHPDDEALLEFLRAVRLKLAQKERVPAYIVCNNVALADMALKRPHTPEEFLEVNGIGEFKAARYGAAFMAAIAEYEKTR